MSVLFVGDVVTRLPFKKSVHFEVIEVDVYEPGPEGYNRYGNSQKGVKLRQLDNGEVMWSPYRFVSKVAMPNPGWPSIDSVL